jgi:alkylated DNA repair dioxygenase AlkB
MEVLKAGLTPLPDAELQYIPGFLPPDRADALFMNLLEGTPWRQDDIRIFGKTYPQPRLTALYGVSGRTYTYSGITMHPEPFPPALENLRSSIEAQSGQTFTTCLLNLYRDGEDSNGWHADNERELGPNPFIASVSLGQTRAFHLKHRTDPSLRFKLLLEHGSLLIMGGAMQHHWLHQVPKTRKPVGQRINLTFRKIIG